MRFPDAARSRAVLIGVSEFHDGELPALPAVDNNVAGLKSVLTDPRGVGLSAQHCRDAVNESDSNVLAQYLDDAAKEADDMLFVYYSGHGLIHEDDLVLSLPTTDHRRPWGHGMRMTDIRKLVARSRAANRVLVLDCCFSGRAVDLMSSLEATVTGQVRIDGTLTLTSTPPNDPASAPVGAAYTAFTGELLSFLRNGDPSAPELLTIRCVYDHLKTKLASRSLPSPQLLGSGNTFNLALGRNPAIAGGSMAESTEPGQVESLAVDSFQFDAVRLLRAVVDEALRTADYRTTARMMEFAHELNQRADSMLVRVSGADMQAETSEAVRRLFAAHRADPGRRQRCLVAYSAWSEAETSRMIARARPMPGDETDWSEFQDNVEVVADQRLDVDTYALLHNAIGPMSAMRWWREQLDQLYRNRSSPHDMVLRLEAAARELIDLRRAYGGDPAVRAGFRFWQRDDRQPDKIERGEVIVARSRVGWRELRDGAFASRAALLNRAVSAFLEWQSSSRQHLSEGRLPIFWLGGEHGVGKSVLLLQLLGRLAECQLGPIAWLGGQVNALPAALSWFDQFGGNWHGGLVALDDPYLEEPGTNVEKIWSEVITRYVEAAERDLWQQLPLLVCCGPARRLAAFRAEFGDRLQVKDFDVPACDRDEIAGMQRWYHERTGRWPVATFDEVTLPLYVLAEWQEEQDERGGTETFSFDANYRRRVETADGTCGPADGLTLHEFIGRAAAMNRLDVGYPSEAVAHLLDEQRLGRLPELYVSKDDATASWALHARLADSVFTAWYPPAEPAQRARVVYDAVADLTGIGTTPAVRNAPLWALARMASRDGADKTALAGRLPMAYAQALRRDLKLEDLPVWVELSACYADARLEPHPVGIALTKLTEGDPNTTGTRLTCHKLLQHRQSLPDYADEITRVIVELLKRDDEWPGWSWVAQDAVRRIDDPELHAILARFLDARPRAAIGEALHQLWQGATGTLASTLEGVVARRLPDAPPNDIWAKIAQLALEKGQPDLRRAAYQWVRRNAGSASVGRPLSTLLRSACPADELWDLARSWCAEWHGAAWANWVLEPLVKHQASAVQPEVWQWCVRWLEQEQGDPTYLLQLIVRHAGEPELLDRVLAWLGDAPDQDPAWGYVWSDLWRREHARDELAPMGRECLRGTLERDSASWVWVWGKLWEDLDQRDAELVGLADRWVRLHPEHKSLPWLLLPLAEWDRDYAPDVLKFLASTSTQANAWHVVWDRFRRLPGVEEREDYQKRLLELGSRWLADHTQDEITADWPGIPIWLHVAWSSHKDKQWPYFHIGRNWLRRVDGARPDQLHAQPHRVWQRMWKRYRGEPELVEIGLKLLANTELMVPSRPWMSTFQRLAQHDESAVAPHAVTYMRAESHRSQDTPSIVRALREARPINPELVAETIAWLEGVPEASSPTWREIWRIAADWVEVIGVADLAERMHAVASRPFETRTLADSKMGSFWLRAWEFGVDRDSLVDAVLATDETQLPLSQANVRIWRLCRAHRTDSPELDRIGHRWLASASHVGGHWGEVFAELWDRTQDQRVLGRLLGLLRRTDLPAPEVQQTIRSLIGASRADEETSLPDLRPMIRDELLLMNPDTDPLWGPVFALVGPGDNEELHKAALRSLESVQPTLDYIELWHTLWRSRESAELVSKGIDWLAQASTDHPRWFEMWHLLDDVGIERDRLVSTIENRLSVDVPVAMSTEAAWQAAWQSRPGDDHVARYVELWLTQFLEHSGWPQLWQTAWEAAPGNEMLARTARVWLDRNKANRAWPRIASAVWEAEPAEDLLIAIRTHVISWRTYVERRQELGDLWLIALDAPMADQPLLQQATGWLRKNLSKPTVWAGVWQRCWDLAEGDTRAELAHLGGDWIRKTKVYMGARLRCWVTMWVSLWDADQARDELSRLALQAPRYAAEEPVWLDVATRMMKDNRSFVSRERPNGRQRAASRGKSERHKRR